MAQAAVFSGGKQRERVHPKEQEGGSVQDLGEWLTVEWKWEVSQGHVGGPPAGGGRYQFPPEGQAPCCSPSVQAEASAP